MPSKASFLGENLPSINVSIKTLVYYDTALYIGFMQRGIIYGRVSTHRQDYDRQVNELKEYARRNDIDVVQVFTEHISGTVKTKARASGHAMFEYIQSNPIDIVLVSDISRMGRSAIDVQKTIHQLVFEFGINLYTHQQGLKAINGDGSINVSFKLITDVMANVAQMERERLIENIHSGLAEARRKGKTLGRPKGTIQGKEKTLERYPRVVRELRTGLSLRKVAKLCDVSVNTVRKVKDAMLD